MRKSIVFGFYSKNYWFFLFFGIRIIPDNYPKVILPLDEDPEADYEGIRRINALDWLVGKAELN